MAPHLPVSQCRSRDEALRGEKHTSEGERKPLCWSLPPVTEAPAGTSAGCPHHPDTEPKAGRVMPVHPTAGTDHSTGRGMLWAEPPVPRSTWHTAAIRALRKTSGKTHCPPPLALVPSSSTGETMHIFSRSCTFESPGPPPVPFLRATEEASPGRWERCVGIAYSQSSLPPCTDTQATMLCSNSTICHGISLQGITHSSTQTQLGFSSLPRCHWGPVTHARIACL